MGPNFTRRMRKHDRLETHGKRGLRLLVQGSWLTVMRIYRDKGKWVYRLKGNRDSR